MAADAMEQPAADSAPAEPPDADRRVLPAPPQPPTAPVPEAAPAPEAVGTARPVMLPRAAG